MHTHYSIITGIAMHSYPFNFPATLIETFTQQYLLCSFKAQSILL